MLRRIASKIRMRQITSLDYIDVALQSRIFERYIIPKFSPNDKFF